MMHPGACEPQSALIERLRSTSDARPRHSAFGGVDLRGADLSGLSFSHMSFAGARFDGANLEGTRFWHVELTEASFRDAHLAGARFEAVHAGSACFASARARQSRWEQVNLTGADFSHADLTAAVIRGCTLEGGCLDGADLTGGSLAFSNCCQATLRGTTLDDIDTVGASFTDADLSDCRRFFNSRELVVEILRREIGDDLERARLVGAVAVQRRWCYAEWRHILASQPEYFDLALHLFRRYPASGCAEALRGAHPPQPGP